MARRVKRERNGGKWTDAEYFSAIRSALRHKFRYWYPAQLAKIRARREYSGGGRRKWEYQCASCKQYFPDKEINIDHIEPVGSLKSLKDLEGFVRRLTPEDVSAYQVLCSNCHQRKTNLERRNKGE